MKLLLGTGFAHPTARDEPSVQDHSLVLYTSMVLWDIFLAVFVCAVLGVECTTLVSNLEIKCRVIFLFYLKAMWNL